MLVFRCECGQALGTEETYARQAGQCVACGRILRIPESAPEVAGTLKAPAPRTAAGIPALEQLEEISLAPIAPPAKLPEPPAQAPLVEPLELEPPLQIQAAVKEPPAPVQAELVGEAPPASPATEEETALASSQAPTPEAAQVQAEEAVPEPVPELEIVETPPEEAAAQAVQKYAPGGAQAPAEKVAQIRTARPSRKRMVPIRRSARLAAQPPPRAWSRTLVITLIAGAVILAALGLWLILS